MKGAIGRKRMIRREGAIEIYDFSDAKHEGTLDT
jgi:hypothetical protein